MFSATKQFKGDFALLHKATKPDVHPKIPRYKRNVLEKRRNKEVIWSYTM